MAIFSKAKAKERARAESARQGLLAFKSQEAIEGAKARQEASEEARLGVFGMLGAPGTYNLPGTGGGGGTPGAFATDIYDTTSDRVNFDPTSKGLLGPYWKKYLNPEARKEIEEGKRKGIIDPKKFQEAVSQTAGFRIQSRLTAQAEQLLAQEGPEWDKLSQSTIGQIYEGAATQMREGLRDLKNKAAKGGSARRTALNEANEILMKQQTAEMRINQTWQANLKLHNYVVENAIRAQRENANFLDNLPGIRDNYNATMNTLAEAMVASSATASQISMSGYQARAAVGDSKFLEKLIIGVVGLVASGATGGAATSAAFDSLADDATYYQGSSGASYSGGGGSGLFGDIGAGIGNAASGIMNAFRGGGGTSNPDMRAIDDKVRAAMTPASTDLTSDQMSQLKSGRWGI